MVLVNLKGPLTVFKRAENYIDITVLFQIASLAFGWLKSVTQNPNGNTFAAVRTGGLKKVYSGFSPSFCK